MRGFIREIRIVSPSFLTGEPAVIVEWHKPTKLNAVVESQRLNHAREYIQKRWNNGEITTEFWNEWKYVKGGFK